MFYKKAVSLLRNGFFFTPYPLPAFDAIYHLDAAAAAVEFMKSSIFGLKLLVSSPFYPENQDFVE